MADLLLGIDVGTSGVKAGLVDAEGRLLGLGRAPCRMETPHSGWAQSDPTQWWHGVIASIHDACDAAQRDPADVAAVGLSVLFPSVTLLDDRGRPLHPAILYCDRRSLAQVKAIEAAIPRDEYQGITGNRLVPGTCAATSVRWLQDEAAQAYADAHVIAFTNTFVAAKLTGSFVTDPSMAAVTGLVDIRDPWRWSEALCEKLGIDVAGLPKIAGAASVVGAVSREAADETGLKVGTPVVPGCGDVPASAFGAGARDDTSLVYVAGSTDCVTAPMSRPGEDLRRVHCAYVPRDSWLAIGTTTSSGVSVDWFVREFLGMSGRDGLDHMTQLAADSPPGSTGPIFLPYLQGERTPVWDPEARGVFLGLSNATTRGDMARAVFEGTAFALRHVFTCLDDAAMKKVHEIRAVGGGTKNALWNQIKADVLQKPLSVLEFQETGALGAALLAGMGTGVYRSFEEAVAVARAAGGTRTITPDPGRAALYDQTFQLYTQIHGATQEIAHALSRR